MMSRPGLRLAALALFLLPTFHIGPLTVFAQYDKQENPSPTSAELEKCRELGISAEVCSENAILVKTRSYDKGFIKTDDWQQFLGTIPIIGIVGVIIGGSAAAIFIITLRKREQADQH